MHPIPIVYGLTIGELAAMIKGEGWLKSKNNCDLKLVKCQNYDHNSFYELNKAPSPNLRTTRSILLYPSLCLFEGTIVSVGRGTEFPFEVIGIPDPDGGTHTFTPKPSIGAKIPLYNGKQCYGINLHGLNISDLRSEKKLNLTYLMMMYNKYKKPDFFLQNNFFDKLAGNSALRHQILEGKDESYIRNTWQNNIEKYKGIRKKYLLYKDFE